MHLLPYQYDSRLKLNEKRANINSTPYQIGGRALDNLGDLINAGWNSAKKVWNNWRNKK